jgi:hypothetical protein
MRIQGNKRTISIINWLERKKFKYSMDLQRSDPFHGLYYLSFNSKQEEMITRIAWGLI